MRPAKRLASQRAFDDRLADEDAVFHLFKDPALFAFDQIAVDLDAAVDWCRMHDDCTWLHLCGTLFGQTVALKIAVVITHVGKLCSALSLDAQHDDRIRPGNAFIEIREREPFTLPLFRSGKADIGMEAFERLFVGSGDTAVRNVADDQHIQPVEVPELVVNRQQVEQALRWMVGFSIAGVDDRDADGFELIEVAVLRAADDQKTIAECLKCTDGIVKRFPFRKRRGFRIEIDTVEAQPLLGA